MQIEIWYHTRKEFIFSLKKKKYTLDLAILKKPYVACILHYHHQLKPNKIYQTQKRKKKQKGHLFVPFWFWPFTNTPVVALISSLHMAYKYRFKVRRIKELPNTIIMTRGLWPAFHRRRRAW